MGHHNIQFTGQMINLETDQQGHSHLHPAPCVFYSSVANFAEPNNHSVVPAPGSQCNFNFHPLPEHNDGAMFYGVPPYNGIQPQHPPANLDLALAASPGHYNSYMVLPSGGYFRNTSYVDDFRSFKRKNVVGAPSYQYQNASAGPSFAVTPVAAVPAESDATQMEAVSFIPPQYSWHDPASLVESGAQRGLRNRAGSIRTESTRARSANNMIQGSYVAPPVQLPGNPWLTMPNVDVGTFAWTQAPNFPYVHAGYSHAPVAQGHSSPPHPTPPMLAFRGYSINYPSQAAMPSRRISSINSPNAGINPFQEVLEAGPAFLAPVPPTGFCLYQSQQSEIMLDAGARQRDLPHLRVLPEDEVAILEVHGYHDAEDSIDLHRDMRLDIDHMSYEELLALGEHIGNVGTGLSEEFIQNNLKIRTFTSPAAWIDIERTPCHDQDTINFCAICQTDYEYATDIGILDCGHEYHRECIKKWLLVKNTCPVCKSTGLNGNGKDL